MRKSDVVFLAFCALWASMLLFGCDVTVNNTSSGSTALIREEPKPPPPPPVVRRIRFYTLFQGQITITYESDVLGDVSHNEKNEWVKWTTPTGTECAIKNDSYMPYMIVEKPQP